MSNKEKRIEIVSKDELRKIITRPTYEIVGKVSDINNLILLCITTRGVNYSDVLVHQMKKKKLE